MQADRTCPNRCSRLLVSQLMVSGTRSGTAPERARVGGGYRPQLDALRFFAIAGILVAHNLDPGQAPWIFSRFDYAETGVRLFFVLSGFLITGILLGEREAADAAPHRRISAIRRFYARRFLRIFPIYYLTLAVVSSRGWRPRGGFGRSCSRIRRTFMRGTTSTGRAHSDISGRSPWRSSSTWYGH